MTQRFSAAANGLTACHTCGKTGRFHTREQNRAARCPRCGTRLYIRKTDSIARTWALLISAALFYIPANVYPVMTFIHFGQGEGDTIISGCETLIRADMWPLALLVFTASIFVPLVKILGLGFLLVSVQLKWSWRPKERTRMYRWIEVIGRWSMLDIFLISLMTALVQLGSVATITAGPGVRSFAAVVILTMFAAMSFDPRLIWDHNGNGPES